MYKETWENYTFTDEEGLVWYGSRCLDRMVFDDIDSLKTLQIEYQNKLDEVESQMRSLVVPLPPNALDYRLSSDGSIDKKAYSEAMQNYNNEREEYERQIKELNRVAAEISYQLQTLDAKIAEMELEERTSKVQEEIDTLKASPNANPDLINALEKQLEFVKTTGTNTSYEKTMLIKQQADVRLALFNLNVPVPPNAIDFMRSDGTVDEQAYSEAMQQYEFELYNYEQDKQVLEEQLSIINNALSKIELEEKAKSTDFDKLEKNIDVANTIQRMLDNTPDTPENRELIANLKAMLAELARNVGNQTKIMESLSRLQEEMKNTEFPKPPKASDFMKVVYSFTMGPNKYTIKDLEEYNGETYIAFLSDGTLLKCQPVFDENGSIIELTILQDNGSLTRINVTSETVCDEAAYKEAFSQYEYECYKYDENMSEINRYIEGVSEVLSSLENQVTHLNFNSCTSVLQNKISELRANGNNEQADALENKLNDLKDEFIHIQQQKNNLLNRQRALTNRLNSLVPPTPPSTNDYLNADGSVNERAYKRAFEGYEKQNSKFDRITARINEQLEFIQKSLNQLNEREAAIQSEIEKLAQ